MKKDDSIGVNGFLNGIFSQGWFNNFNLNVSGNFCNGNMNIFGGGGYGEGEGFNKMNFVSF